MSRRLQRVFQKALGVAIATPSDVAAGIDRAYRTLKSYRDADRAVTVDAANALSGYLRRKAREMLKAADVLDRTITREEARHAEKTKTK